MSDCFICVRNQSLKMVASSQIRASATVRNVLSARLSGVSSVNPNKIKQPALIKGKLNGLSSIRSYPKISQNLKALGSSEILGIKAALKISGVLRSRIASVANISQPHVDKFAGNITKLNDIDNFASVQKLYPIRDITTNLNNSYFVNKNLSSGNLYSSIDEGIFTGNYNQNFKTSRRISDDNLSFIQPSSVFTSGTFRYKCEVSRPYHDPKNSFLFVRASAPLSNYGSNVPPEYRIHNIKLEDPSGNLIIKYKDIVLRGDADYSSTNINYSTYISEPLINNALLNTWQQDYPIMYAASGYTLNMDFDVVCLDDPFAAGFDVGYEELSCPVEFLNSSNNDYLALDGSPLSSQTQGYILNPTNTLRISALEICNSGDLCSTCSVSGIKFDSYVGFYAEVASIGQRLSRNILPVELLINDYDVNIYPEVYTLWTSSPDGFANTANNASSSGSQVLISKLQTDSLTDYITLTSNSPTVDSGRLTLKFSHSPPNYITSLSDGSFGFGKVDFDRATPQQIAETDNYFKIDSIELKVIAKKAIGSRDYVLDVIGYSDDRILNITPKISAFLQNEESTNPRSNTITTNWLGGRILSYAGEGSGKPLYTYGDESIYWNGYSWVMENVYAGIMYESTDDTSEPWLVESWTPSDGTIVYDPLPMVSGFRSIDDLGIATNPLSNKYQYFENSSVNDVAGDHYLLSTLPIVSGTTFQEYTIPLKIYLDEVTLGKPIDYSLSSYFENLYLDLYPIPTGASIATVQLVIYYKPSNALMLHTLGTPSSKELGTKDIRLLPLGRESSNDILINSDIADEKLSYITGIPHGYGEPTTLKTNYSRRWRGIDGNVVNGPYHATAFDFSFYNPEANSPFLDGYYDFTNVSGNFIISDDYAYSGYYNGSETILKNIGWRFKTDQLFPHSTDYTTIDWAQSGDSLYGKICDAFDSALRVSGEFGNVNFGNLPLYSGFAFYIRFTPDYNMSGVDYNFFNSGVIASQYDNGKDLDFWLGFENERLTVKTTNTSLFGSPIVSVTGKLYHEYQYPLSTLVYHTTNALLLLAYNEIDDNESPSYSVATYQQPTLTFSSGDSNFVVGYCNGSGVSANIFVHEIGFSIPSNINLEVDRSLKKTTFKSFFDSHGHTFLHNTNVNTKLNLPTFVDEDTSLWKLGDFKICSFSPDFDSFTKRVGQDLIIHRLKHDGSAYGNTTDIALPSSIYASGLAYHTQIENDFLRFNLQDIPDVNSEFYTTQQRICKTLPRGYDFKEGSLVVESIIEHDTYNDIIWPEGKIGPKLIVSLYSKNQDPINRPSKVNWGLVNRAIHYLKPSGCWQKLRSTFNYNDLIDTSEPWANFDIDNIRSEFDHKYYSTDINDMFLQYDIAYPSGSAFDSSIKIHSITVKLEDALTYFADSNNDVNLYASGDKVSRSDIDLFTYGLASEYAGINLYVSGQAWPTTSSNLNLYSFGIDGISYNNLGLFLKNSGVLTSSMDIYVSGGNPRSETNMPLVIIDNTSLQTTYSSMPLYVINRGLIEENSFMPLVHVESYIPLSPFNSEILSLVTYNNQEIPDITSNSFSLYVNSDPIYYSLSGSVGLYTINYPAYNQQVNQQASVSWNKNNIGESISASDNDKAYLEANDEIRGVDLLCYGNCDNAEVCREEPIYLHDTFWYDQENCIDGGILRAKNTYTNLDVSGFKTPIGYSGHFYGIRKYEGLIPNAPYNITITAKTGSNTSIELPKEFKELDYGSNEYVNYSGVKITADDERQSGNRFGKSVAAKYDLMAIGAPLQTVSYSEYDSSGNLITTDLSEAGTVFIYRREARPSGINWPDNKHKSPWLLEDKLTLPSGLLKDYPTNVYRNTINGIDIPYPITERFWNVGQEGRQFGHSLDIAVNNSLTSFQEDKKEIIVVGGPSAKWSRDFEDLSTSGVSIGLIIFTDEFVSSLPDPSNPRKNITYTKILETIQNKDLVFQYFSDPPVRFDVKLIICEPFPSETNIAINDFPVPQPAFITKKRIPRNEGILTEENTLAVFSGIKNAFEETFPYDNTKIHNNIPVMLGIYVDNSRSLGRSAVAPALDRFIQHYQNYSFASGLQDFNNIPASGAVYEYIPTSAGSEDWISMSNIILNTLLDTGRLVSDDQVKYFASGLGPDSFNLNLSQFNHPPASGGKVYIFEKESGVWNLIQEIESPEISYDSYDRFGHSVAISEDTSTIAIGSPYINEACKVYQYKNLEKQRLFDSLYSWLTYRNSLGGGLDPRYVGLVSQYQTWLEIYGFNYSNQILYSKLTSTEKFEARKYLEIEEYENIFTYAYNNIPYVGNEWSFIPQRFAPTSRLGYSVAINDDGTTIAIGAPTDSFNAFDDLNVYYKNDGYLDPLNIDNVNGFIKPSWRSNVNAGAVRLLESRDYYPHNKVVEFGKFGNLQESLNDPLDSGHFNYLSNIFQYKEFSKTPFDQVSIPSDAGLAFIITPQVDATSDEVIDNIISWLALGDRNLVLVGNDPIWENNGAYEPSNLIVNKILEKINSKMRLYPARTQYESLPSGGSLILPSYRPRNSTDTYVRPFELNNGFGVADIRIHFPGFSKYMPCNDDGINDKCQLPLVHKGDLRAEWKESCTTSDCGGRQLKYAVNWPFIFKTFTPNCCDLELETINTYRFDLENQEPVPLLAAGETTISTSIIPAIPAVYGQTPIFETKTAYSQVTVYNFDYDNLQPQSAFTYNAANSGYSSYLSNIDGASEPFYRPSLFEDRQSLLQAQASPITETIYGSQKVATVGRYCVEQTIGQSKIVAIAGVATESKTNLLSGQGDNNINFYSNLVSKTLSGGSVIAQLGGWTGRQSFIDAYSESILYDVFRNSGNDVHQNVLNISVSYDVCWIANPIGLPSEDDIVLIQTWLGYGNKTLIITHDNTISQMLLVKNILELLGTSIKPLYLPVQDKYPLVNSNGMLNFNPNHPVSQGFGIYPISEFRFGEGFIPYDAANGIVDICYDPVPIYDTKIISDGYWKIDSGIDKITFPAVAGSGYKIFVDVISESIYETQPIQIYIKNASEQPSLPYPQSFTVRSVSANGTIITDVGPNAILENAIQNKIKTYSFDVQVLENKNTIEVFFNAFNPRISQTAFIPKTIRIASMSGIAMPIGSAIVSNNRTYQELVGFNTIKLADAQPEIVISEPVTREISSLNDRYCISEDCEELGLSNQYIADGPVVVAQETESVSSFNAGVARSKITLISDSSLVQGRFMADEFGRIPENTVAFLTSLYPDTTFPSEVFGRQYINFTKIVGPERGSPQKYFALTSNSGSRYRFGINGTAANLSAFDDKESMYDPRYVLRTELPWTEDTPEIIKEYLKNEEISTFAQGISNYGCFPKFSGIINAQSYVDAGIEGGMPSIMKDTGSDYLDFDVFTSGYPGDLFGFSVSLHKNKLVIGAPFSAFKNEVINNWNYYIQNNGQSGIELSYNGGAGAVYIYEKTFNGSGIRNTKTPWEFIQKLRPTSINVGQDISNSGASQSYLSLGPNSYTTNYLQEFSNVTDQFGYDVAIDSDIIIVGAPGHDFGKYISDIYASGSYIRKAFNEEFDIPSRNVLDLGNSGVRNSTGSGLSVLNNGAIFTFENRIIDWPTRTTKWTFVEKVLQQGENSREQLSVSVSGTENENFGRSIYIHKSNRSDSDYVIVAGSDKHIYSTSGTSPLLNAGAAYTNDIMLRDSYPAIANPSTYIDAKVFGERDANNEPTTRIIVSNSTNDQLIYATGIVYSDENGAIFLEASGQDPAIRGFIQHRPFIVSVDGLYRYGTTNNDSIPLFIDSTSLNNENMNLFLGATTGNVYNSIGLYSSSITDFGSGVLNFYTDCPNPTTVSESGFSLFMASGIGLSTDSLNMRIRGFQ